MPNTDEFYRWVKEEHDRYRKYPHDDRSAFIASWISTDLLPKLEEALRTPSNKQNTPLSCNGCTYSYFRSDRCLDCIREASLSRPRVDRYCSEVEK